MPPIVFGLEYFAKFYRTTGREVQRMYLAPTSTVYQGIVQAATGQVALRALVAVPQTLCMCTDALDRLRRMIFAGTCVAAGIDLRMDVIGYGLTRFNLLLSRAAILRRAATIQCCARCGRVHALVRQM